RLPASASDDWSGKPALVEGKKKQDEVNKDKPKAPPAAQRPQPGQLRCLAAIDEGVGKLLEALEQSKKLDDTLFVFTSDNGFFWGEHKLGDKRAAYEESIRIPLVVRCPRLVKAGTKPEELMLNIDTPSAFLAAAGVKVPATMQGKTLLPVWKGDKVEWRTSFFTEYYEEKQFPRIPTWKSVRTETWKYIRYDDHPEWD